ncbi:MAG: transposase, partial [Kiritimatiellia bacterium]|nr:transposase [Kiritimatiellia bacterium]
HDDSFWQPTRTEGIEVQEIEWQRREQRLIVIRQRIAQRPDAGGKMLFDMPGYRLQAFITSLPDSYTPLDVWYTYNGRADCENRIREIGAQFGLRGLCCKRFWATEAAHQLAVATYNLCVLFQRELGLARKVELRTLRTHFFCRAAVWSRSQNAPTLRIGLSKKHQPWWNQILERLISPLPPSLLRCNAAEIVYT